VIMDESGGFMQAQALPVSWAGVLGIGAGTHPLAWMSLEDALGAIVHLLKHPSSEGVYHLVAPEVVSAKAFHQAWAKALKMPFWGSLPAWILYPILGESMVRALMEEGVPAVPRRLTDEGFHFLHPDLASLFTHAVDIQNWREWLISKL